MRTALIDADILVYRAAQQAETPFNWKNNLWTYAADARSAVMELNRMTFKIRDGLRAERVVMALSDYELPNWRKSVYPDYKLQRGFKRRPILWGELRKYIQDADYWESIKLPGLEGDDVLGILLTEDSDEERICVSLDKDMHTLPGTHLHMEDAINFDDGELYELSYNVSEEEADFFHLQQAVAGDRTDGYAGCEGIGMTRAERYLKDGKVFQPYEHTFSRGQRKGETETRWEAEEPGTPWEVAVSIYESKGMSEEDALANARVARILRDGEYDPDTGEVHLWTPPKK